MQYDESIVIPSSTGINLPFNIITPDIETDSKSSFEVENTNKDLIEKINLSRFQLIITSPNNGDFKFLNSISAFISADNLPEVKMAWKDSISENIGNTLLLDISNTDLKEYIIKDKINLRLNTVTDEILSSDYQIDIHLEFFIDAKILI